MWIETQEQMAAAIERLRRLDPTILAKFIVLLSQDAGPVGEQVRTFIVGDDVVQASESLQKRIVDLATTTEYAHRHSRGSEIGASLSFILDGIESLVLPADAASAFGLLVKVFEADALAMENCGDHHFDVEHAFRRAAELMTAACKAVPEQEALAKISALLAVDCYGVRQGLAHVISNRGDV